MTEKLDPAALAERLDTQINGMWGLVTSHPHIVSPQFLEFLMEVSAALRQRPQEERPSFFDCVQCGVSKTVEDQGDDLVCATCWREFRQAKPQAPAIATGAGMSTDTKPDLYELIQALERVKARALMDAGVSYAEYSTDNFAETQAETKWAINAAIAKLTELISTEESDPWLT